MADGTITFSTELDNKELEKQLQSLKKKIASIEDGISQKKAERFPLMEQSKQLSVILDEANAKLHEMQSGKEFFPAAAIREQAATVKGLQADWDKVQKRVEQYDAAIKNATINLDRQKEKAGAIEQELVLAGASSEKMAEATKKAHKSMGKFSMRLREVIRSALVFTVITQTLAKFRDWTAKVVKTNEEASAAMARLKGALLTLAQPLVDVIIPAFIALVDVLIRVVTVLARVLSMLFGTTIDKSKDAAESLYNETEAIEGTGEAAEDAGKSMASFDEINQLSGRKKEEKKKEDEKTAPDFDFQAVETEESLGGILGLIGAIGAGLLALKFPDALLSGLRTAVGLFFAIDGAIGLIRNTMDAWTNGVNFDNFLGMLIRALELVAGLAMAFGKTGAAIGLIITGITLLATGIHDAIEHGWTLQNLLMTITGMIMTGLGISILVHSWIPLIIAGIASVLLAFTVAFGQGDNLIEGAKEAFQGLIDFIGGLFTGNVPLMLRGVNEFFDGISMMIQSIITALESAVFSFFDWLDEKTGKKFSGIIQAVRDTIIGHLKALSKGFYDLFNDLKDIFKGIIEFISGVFTGDWDKAWQGVKDIFTGVINGVITIMETFINVVINGLNLVIKGLNSVVGKVGDFVGVDLAIPSIQSANLPRLATGAVIPPNREFMAVLGDQKSGTNIEAPLDTMVQAFKQAAAETGMKGPGEIKIVFDGDLSALARTLRPYLEKEGRRVGISLVEK